MFLSADSVQGNLQGANPYGYVGGNPETFADPTGRFVVGPSGVDGGSGGVYIAPPVNFGGGGVYVPPPFSGGGWTPPVAPVLNSGGASASSGSSQGATVPLTKMQRPSNLDSCSGGITGQALCGNFGVNYAVYFGPFQIGVPGAWNIGGGSGGGDSGGGDRAGNGDIFSSTNGDTGYNGALLDDPSLFQESEAQLTTTHPDLKGAFTQTIESLERIGGPLGDDVVATQDRGLRDNANGVGGLNNGIAAKSPSRGWRLDYDAEKGVHFNFFDWTNGSRKSGFGRWGAAKISGATQTDFQEIIYQYNLYGVDGMLGYEK